MTSAPAPMLSGRVSTEGDELFYEVRGRGRPLLMIAGGGGDGRWYSMVAEMLSDEYKVITYDRRANARSTMSSPQNFEISQQSRDAAAVLYATGEQSAVVFGNSSGAVIALDMAKTQPQAVRAVVAHEPPLARVHPQSKKWRRFFASVYSTSFRLGATAAALRFIVGAGLIPLIGAASRMQKSRSMEAAEPVISPKDSTEFLVRQELLPVTNYMPDVDAIKRNGIAVFMAAGQSSLRKHRFYAETAVIMAQEFGHEVAILPGHHGSFIDSPAEWADALRRVLHEAESIRSRTLPQERPMKQEAKTECK